MSVFGRRLDETVCRLVNGYVARLNKLWRSKGRRRMSWQSRSHQAGNRFSRTNRWSYLKISKQATIRRHGSGIFEC